MAVKGCHNCGIDLKQFVNKPYETWPCATCPVAKDYSRTFSTGYFESEDTATTETYTMELPDDHFFVTQGKFPLNEEEIQSLETIKRAIQTQMYALFSGLLVKLLEIAKENPVMFEVFIKKMQFPYMSYSEIGDSMEPKCSKQNVLYHLKSIVKMFPELNTVIPTDTRYSGGTYALKTLADRRRQEMAEERIQKNIYGNKYGLFRYLDIKELNRILHLPFNMKADIFKFNPYLRDEDHIAKERENGASEDKDTPGSVQAEGSEGPAA